jgi:hypothetical protein
MTPLDRFRQCRDLALHGPPHTRGSLRDYRILIAREYARREARLARQMPLSV